jgi:uncharacterized membrane protein YdjX (TVP38/TMEM64 family)
MATMGEQSVRSRSRTRLVGRLLAAVLLVGGGSVWTARSGIGIQDLQALLQHHPAAPALFLALHAVFSLLFLPRAVMAMAAGLIFGLWWGLLWAAAGSLLGAVTGFLLSRHLTGGLIDLDERTRFGQALLRVERGGWRAVAMLRLVPVVPHSAANYLLGLTSLSFGSYAVGSLLGQLPMTVAFVQFGTAGTAMLAGRPDWLQPTLIGAALLAASALLPKLAARSEPDSRA